mgnify:CR=1 FL=1
MSKQSPVKLVVFSLMAVLGTVYLVNFVRGGNESGSGAPKAAVPAPVQPLPDGDRVCDPGSLPASGSIQVIAPSRMQRTDVLFSGLEIENRQASPVVVYLTDPASSERVLGMVVWPGKTALASVPVGHYGLFFLKGKSWCNEEAGFRDGSRAVVRGGVEIQAGETRVLSLAGAGSDRPEGVYTSARAPVDASPSPPAVQGDGFIELAQRLDGHYYADGYVNGAPIAFVVDTGATFTTLSREDAYRVGIETCSSRTFHTANGVVEGCVGRVPKIQIGGFVLRDTDVAVLPNQAGAALLGMNILNNFRVEQQGGVMRISAPGA